MEEALKHYEIAVKKDSTNSDHYYNRALVKSKLDKLDEAISDFTKALEYTSSNKAQFNATYNRGICYRKQGRLEESIKDLQQAVQL